MKNILNYIKTLSDNEEEQKLLIETIGNLLLKQKDIENYIKENENKIIHIKDWIFSVVENNEQWKTPRVLTIDALNNTANKYFEKQNSKIKKIELDKEHENLIADLDDYYIIQMLTPEALDNESKQMQHCIGHGGYDEKLKNSEYKYLSLRDKYNKAHATLEIENNKIVQLQGKQNNIPDKKYLEKLLPWLENNNYKNIPWRKFTKYYDSKNNQWIDFNKIKLIENVDFIRLDEKNIHQLLNDKAKLFYNEKEYNYFNLQKDNIDIVLYIKKDRNDISSNKKRLQYLYNNNYKNIPYDFFECAFNKLDNVIYFKSELPDNCEIDCDLYINFKKLPNNLILNGDLNLTYSKIEKLPDNLVVNGNFYLEMCKKIKKIPNNLIMNGSLFLKDLVLNFLPDNLQIKGNLEIDNCLNLNELPNGLFILDDFFLNRTKNIKKIPEDIKIGKNIYLIESNIKKLPDNFVANMDLYLSGSNEIKTLPKNLIVNGSLVLDYCSNIDGIPEDIKIGKTLDISFSGVKKMPENLQCKRIFIDKSKVYLIKETMNFEEIIINGKIYTKQEFFENSQKNDFFFRLNKLLS